uniref:G-protein coupled receptors family 1 profile domain-containing protein n=1 Tax=Myripristis murdjan TaxID=586833 RepID=A0A667X874_9TELE
MEDEFNVTYITLGGHVEVHKYRYLYFVIMFTVYILIICSNSIILCLICIHKSLHEPMYIFIAALLLNSILFSTAIYPKLLMDFLSDKQTISYPLCLFQNFLYYSLGGADFLLLSAMAYDRYVSISYYIYGIVVMINIAVVPILFIVFTSADAKKKAAQTCVPHHLHLIMSLQLFIYHPLFNPIIYGLKMKEISKQLKILTKEAPFVFIMK